MKIAASWDLTDDSPGFLETCVVEFEGEEMAVHFCKSNEVIYATAMIPIHEIELMIRTHREAIAKKLS